MNDILTSQKQTLRAEAKRARGKMSLDGRAQERLCDLFFEHVPLSDNTVVASYYPKGRELDSVPLMDRLLGEGYPVALPVVQKESKILTFALWDGTAALAEGAFGIYEPQNGDLVEPDVFLVPMLAFDQRGGRLGYGGGYYDATLSAYKAKKDILAVGLAYAQQACLFNLPAEEHDIPMDLIVTEQKIYRFDA